jgi:hypothetical protein
MSMAEQLPRFSPEAKRRYERCLKKLGYPSEADAHAVRARRQQVTDEVLRVYGPCEDCGLWHLSHKPLTDTQVRELEDMLRMEIQRFDEAREYFRQVAKPYLKFHVMVGRTPKEVDEDFACQLELHEQVTRYWLAWHQRHHALRLAQATSSDEARWVDRRGREILEKAVRLHRVSGRMPV